MRPREAAGDPRAEALRRQASEAGVDVARVGSARVYLVEGALTAAQAERLAGALLADPVLESWSLGAGAPETGAHVAEVHPLPGVMDPVAQTVREQARELLGVDDLLVQTGVRYDMLGVSARDADALARRFLANTVIHAIHGEPYVPEALPRGGEYELKLTHVPIRELDDDGLARLSREGHLFLSLEEMRAIRDEYRTLEREPTDIELETLAQTWSEHCVHKTLKSRVRYDGPAGDVIRWEGRPGHEVGAGGEVVIDNLLKRTVAAATHELIADGVDWTLSVFVDNAGVVAFDDEHAVCIKVETHNHPSALEPYGGAATGIGGCIRDVIGTGLAARPIANTDVFCVAHPTLHEAPAGCLHPKRILTQVVAGVRDYGNRVGVPTVAGAVHFDDRYVGNPLVFCGCIGVLPRHLVEGAARAGDRIIALGGRTGRDGIHGATFSSAELTDSHADEFSHAVQIGNAIEEKRVLDAILRARDEHGAPLFSAITDCGAGGFSSAVGEMGEKLGATVELERAPLKYDGLSYTEIWISEAQERMVLAVPAENIATLQRICDEERVELADLGEFGTEGRELVLRYGGTEVGRLPMEFLHDGLPTPRREARWRPAEARARKESRELKLDATLLKLLSHPTIASKGFVVEQYDHEVRGGTVIKPLVGPKGEGPGAGAVIRPVAGSKRGLAIAQGLQTPLGDAAIGGDPYFMALSAIDECVRNLVCLGADPERIAILDNFCWPSCGKPDNLGALVRASEGCYDGAKAYRTPFVSGKDSLNNQFTTESGLVIEIPFTLLITGMGIVEDIGKCVTTDLKRAGNALVLVGESSEHLGCSHLSMVDERFDGAPALPDVQVGVRNARAVAELIGQGVVRAAHDCSEGGLLVALAEMCIGGGLGAAIHLSEAVVSGERSLAGVAFGEAPHRYLLEVPRGEVGRVRTLLGGVPHSVIGEVTDDGKLHDRKAGLDVTVEALRGAWMKPLDW